METLIIIAKSAAILTLFYVLYLVVLRKDTFFSANRHYLLAGIIAAFIIPFIEFTKTVYMDMPILSDTPIVANDFNPVAWQTIPQEVTFQVNWWLVALVIYTIGVLVMISRLGIQLYSLTRLLKKHPSEQKNGYTYVTVTDDIAPFSFFRTICYNPALHTEAELQMILEHEKVHASQWHTIDVLLTQVVLAFQWVNPLAWFYKQSLEQNLEFIADSNAVQSVPSPKAYQHTLVKVSSTALRPALTNQFYHSLIKKRIVMLNKEASRRRNLWKLGLVLPLIGLFMYSFNVKEVVEYREPLVKEGDTAFAKADSEITPERTFTLQASMTNQEIETLIDLLENDAENLAIRFTNRTRTQAGALSSFLVETKYPNQKRFYQNVTYGEGALEAIPDVTFQIVNGNDLQFSDFEEKMIFRTSLNGVQAEMLSQNNLPKIPKLGKNPAYIINGETKTANELKDKIVELDGEVELLGKEEATALYGSKAKDGALVLKGTANLKEETQETTPIATKISQELTKGIAEEIEKFKTQELAQQEVRIKINKNTTDAQLDAYKEDLMRDHGIDLSYNLRRNPNREITMIQVSYTGGGHNGNYSISGDDPIDEFFFFMNEAGETGFWSERSEERREERRARMEERRAAMTERREVINEAREVRREEMQERREEMRERMDTRGEEMKEQMKERKEEMKLRQEEMKEQMKGMKQRMKEMHKRSSASSHSDTNSWTHDNDANAIHINKSSTDEEIQAITQRLKEEGITFSFTKVKRNAQGEITGYRMKFDDNKGTESVSSKKSSNTPISPLSLIYSDGTIRVHQ